jgi:hypothetical protein
MRNRYEAFDLSASRFIHPLLRKALTDRACCLSRARLESNYPNFADQCAFRNENGYIPRGFQSRTRRSHPLRASQARDTALRYERRKHRCAVPRTGGGRMVRVALPERVFFARQFLCKLWQIFEAFPEASIRLAGHGKSSRLPARMFLRTSSSTGRRRPCSPKSASVSRSQAAFSRSRMNEASSANSRGESVSTASLISARLTSQPCQA